MWLYFQELEGNADNNATKTTTTFEPLKSEPKIETVTSSLVCIFTTRFVNMFHSIDHLIGTWPCL